MLFYWKIRETFDTFMAKPFLNQVGAILFHSKKTFYGNFKNIFFDDEFLF